MMQIDEITPIHVGAAPLIRGLIDKLNIVEIIDEQASKAAKQAKLSVGTRIKAMIIQILTDRKALYRMEEWYAEQDVELLVGPGVEAQDLNDDALSRALDHLGKMDFNSLYSKVAMQGLALLQDPSTARFLHMDTTSLSVYGQYEKKQEDESLTITHGYSKDHRPDLKQFKFGLAVQRGCLSMGMFTMEIHMTASGRKKSFLPSKSAMQSRLYRIARSLVMLLLSPRKT